MVKPQVIVHIPFQLGYRASGGGIRPQKMIQAFKDNGYEVTVIAGTHAERAEHFKAAWKQFERGELNPVGIYSESSANPTIITDYRHWYQFRDFYYLRRFHKAGKKVVLFYRDIHWNFTIAGKSLSKLKWLVLKSLHYLDLLMYTSFVDVITYPSVRMGDYVPFNGFFAVIDELPPGHDVTIALEDKSFYNFPKRIYVGGVLPPVYDVKKLFQVTKPITICCREDEWKQISSYYGKVPKNVNLVHLSGKELAHELTIHHLAVMVREEHNYLNFSQPLKFYESIGYELPIIVSSGSLVAEQVKNWKIGWINPNPDMEISREDYSAKVNQIRKIKYLHSWKARAAKVVELFKK